MPQNPSDVAARWLSGLSNSVSKYKEKVQGLQNNPLEAAASQGDKMVQGVAESVNSGRWGQALRDYGFSNWKQRTAEVGGNRLVSGAQASKGRMQEFLSGFLGYAENLSQQVKQMPNTTDEDKFERIKANYYGMKQAKGKF